MANTDYKSIDEYIKTFPGDVQEILGKIRQTIHQAVPNATEAISYQLPTIKVNGKYLIYFSAWKQHVSLYPVPKGSASFNKKLAPFIKGKGTIQFLLDKPIPYEFIKEIVQVRLKENLDLYKRKSS